MPDPTDPWWQYALDPETRADPDANRLRDASGAPLVNPPGAGGRLGLGYEDYLGLDRLLDAQTPATAVPDERVFVMVHQLCELTFKQMTFDLAVVAATFERLLRRDAEARLALALAEGSVDDPASEASAFWRPAITAANRLRHCARAILPPVMQLMGRSGDADGAEGGDVLFSTVEFGHFRAALTPSSGFQTGQLRLIQRALGKAPLLDLKVFPGDAYGEHYAGAPCGHVALGDPLVLQAGHARAMPPRDHPAAYAAALDGLAHALLASIPGPAGAPPPPAVRRIHAGEVERAADRFRATLGRDASPEARATADAFAGDLGAAVAAENARRDGLDAARAGAYRLQTEAPHSALNHVLARIASLDDALHAPHADTFLTVHRQTVRRHVADESGTGGGGMPYLVTSQRFLLPLFPALVAYLDLEDIV